MPADKPTSKSTKPLMEKRRRARINDSLMQLKSLVLDALNKNNPQHSKLEKADILEMTVRYLRIIQRQQISAPVNHDPSKLGQYRSGYAECFNEVTRYIGASSSTDGSPELRTQLVGHLANMCTSGQQQPTSPTRTPSPQHHQQTQYTRIRQQQLNPTMIYVDAESRMSPSTNSDSTSAIFHNGVARSPVPEGTQPDYALTTPVYNKTQQVRNVTPASNNYPHVVVSPHFDNAGRSSGEITVVLPQQTLSNGQLPTHFIPVYAQGPIDVSKTTETKQQALSPSQSGVSLLASPLSACTSPVTFVSSPVSHAQQLSQTELSPVAVEQYANYEMETPISNHCISKKETMWRPW